MLFFLYKLYIASLCTCFWFNLTFSKFICSRISENLNETETENDRLIAPSSSHSQYYCNDKLGLNSLSFTPSKIKKSQHNSITESFYQTRSMQATRSLMTEGAHISVSLSTYITLENSFP